MEQLEFSIIGIDSEEHICLPMFEGAHLTPRLPRWGIILKVACILWKTYGCYVGPSLDGGTLGVTDDAFVLSLLGKGYIKKPSCGNTYCLSNLFLGVCYFLDFDFLLMDF